MLIYCSAEAPLTDGRAIIRHSAATSDGRVRLSSVLRDLARREINEVHVEGGAELAASLLAEQLVDELIIYQAPLLLGSDAKELVAVQGFTSMEQRLEFQYIDVVQIGPDTRLTLKPLYPV